MNPDDARSKAKQSIKELEDSFEKLKGIYPIAAEGVRFDQNKKERKAFQEAIKKGVKAKTMSEQLGEIQKALHELYRDWGADTKFDNADDILGNPYGMARKTFKHFKPHAEAIKTIMETYNQLEQIINDESITPEVKYEIRDDLQEMREKWFKDFDRHQKKPNSSFYDDMTDILRFFIFMTNSFLLLSEWRIEGEKGRCPRIFVGIYTDSKGRRRPITKRIC